jgi:alkylation response protein AidB-like acyl-CoA dehydrogenase
MQVSSRYQPIADADSRARGNALLAWLRDYGAQRINSRLIDERRTIPPYVVLDLARQGVLGIQVEPRWGGLGLRNREVARVLEQAAGIDLALGTFVLVCLFPGVRPIAAFAGDALKREVLPLLAEGRMLAGYAQTEPGAGTHFQAMEARAVANATGGWRLSGHKWWIGNATWAGVLTAMAHDVDARGRRKGLTAFAVRTDQPGVALGRELLSMGMRGVVQSEVAFHEVAVAEDAVLGVAGRGLEVGVDSMSWSRFAIAATCIGAMKRCAQLMARFGERRWIATGRLLDHPVVLAALGEAAARIRASEGLLYRVAAAIDAGQGVAVELFAACKLMASEFLCETADRLVQTLGSRGYDEENLAPQLLRDARVTRIFEGTSEALQAFLGAAVLAPTSELWTFLRDELAAGNVANDLAEAVTALRARTLAGGAGEPDRAWQCALAGQAVMWALAAAVLARDPGAPPSERAWAEVRFSEALAALRAGGAAERVLHDPVTAQKIVAGYADAIGDIDQNLPGERLGLDPLLRKDGVE